MIYLKDYRIKFIIRGADLMKKVIGVVIIFYVMFLTYSSVKRRDFPLKTMKNQLTKFLDGFTDKNQTEFLASIK